MTDNSSDKAKLLQILLKREFRIAAVLQSGLGEDEERPEPTKSQPAPIAGKTDRAGPQASTRKPATNPTVLNSLSDLGNVLQFERPQPKSAPKPKVAPLAANGNGRRRLRMVAGTQVAERPKDVTRTLWVDGRKCAVRIDSKLRIHVESVGTSKAKAIAFGEQRYALKAGRTAGTFRILDLTSDQLNVFLKKNSESNPAVLIMD